jgi:hypothetical protein
MLKNNGTTFSDDINYNIELKFVLVEPLEEECLRT